jgi:hypothetical protein
VIDLGARKARKIKGLKKGEGELWEEVMNVVDETREILGAKAEGKVLVPVVLIYSKKSGRKGLEKLIFPLMK